MLRLGTPAARRISAEWLEIEFFHLPTVSRLRKGPAVDCEALTPDHNMGVCTNRSSPCERRQ